ncbi:MAG TPA: hypothetical protein VFQ39_01670, partial [Longimicrobium sp.]|nr:hypothetical protein [Longimicrobium sp.]
GAPEPVPGTAVETAKEPGSVVSALMDRVLGRAAAPEKTRGAAPRKAFQLPATAPGAGTAAAVTLPEPPALEQGMAAGGAIPALGATPAAPPAPVKTQGAEHASVFAGNWLYSGEDRSRNDARAYRAFYIELSLEEANGRLQGNYRARYHVPDKAISPEVAMKMEGEAKEGKSSRLTWASGEGAKGVAELTLRGRDTLYMTWWTTEFGRRAGLASGTAQLVRQAVR